MMTRQGLARYAWGRRVSGRWEGESLVRKLRVLGLIVALVAIVGPVGRAASFSCTSARTAPGGDWPFFGRDLGGTRNQIAEHAINAANVNSIVPVWVFNTGSGGAFVPNVSVSGNCVYFMTAPEYSQGSVYALKAGNGQLVWKMPVFANEAPATSGAWAFRGSVAIVNGRLHVNGHSAHGPQGGGNAFQGSSVAKGVAFDANTGRRLWTSKPISFGYSSQSDGGPAVWDGIHLVWTNGPDADPNARPGYALLDAATGKILHEQTTIPASDLDRGYAGGGAWTTPAVSDGYAYVGTANPDSKKIEHEYDNAFIKVDMHRESPTFGHVVGFYKGDWDNLSPQGSLYSTPVCRNSNGAGVIFNQACGQMDVDFSTAPTMVKLPDGRTLLAEMQKGGTFHVVNAATMKLVWKKTVSTWVSFQGNEGAAATDGKNFYFPANPGVLWALNVRTGAVSWVAPIADGLPHHPVSIANGVVYYIGNHGELLGFDAATGLLVLEKNLTQDSGHACDVPWSAAVTIAHNTIFATCDMGPDGGFVVAYRLPKSFK
jgi:outer membrane protein assembly factor BamB